MAPPLLTLQDIHLSFGSDPLLEGAELSVSQFGRLCIVGRNGSGKSTLLKVAAGMIEPDSGKRFVQPGVTIQYLEQEPDFTGFDTVLAYVEAGLGPLDDIYRAQYLLGHLGLSGEENPASLSGGEARRAALARVMAPEPDILILDEPTNHLDIDVIEWLENELQSLRSSIVLISHDKRFLENLTKATIWIDRGACRRMEQNFSGFEAWRDKVLEEEEAERHKLDRKIVREEHWLTYGVTARRKRNVKRLGNLHDLRQQRREARGPVGTARMDAGRSETSGKNVVKADHISKSYDRPVIDDFSIKIQRGDRVGFVGPNGAGKSTLLKMLTGALEPDSGEIKLGTKLDVQVLDQKRDSLNPEWTLKEALTEGSGDMVDVQGQPRHVIGYMKDFLFIPEQARTPIYRLSGGERGRLMLARALAKTSNLLVLDEPTNDLDLETLELLQEMLADYKGTVLLVSHDRDFLDRVVTSVIHYEGEAKWQEYAGGYSDMLAQRGGSVSKKTGGKKKGKKGGQKSGKKTAVPAMKPAQSGGKAKLTNKEQYALKNLPKTIKQLEAHVKKLEDKLGEPDLFTQQPEIFQKASDALTKTHEDLQTAEEEWMALEMKREEIEG